MRNCKNCGIVPQMTVIAERNAGKQNRSDVKKILLVEDEVPIAINTAAVLTDYGFCVVTAYSADEAVEAATEEEIDLVLMDIDLGRGEKDGVEAAEHIIREQDIPVVFITGHTDPKILERIQRLTRYGVVSKSSADFILYQSVQMAFQLFEQHKRENETTERLKSELELRKETERRLKYSETFLNSIIDQSPFPIWISDEKGVLIRLNDASRELFGVSDDNEVVGKYDFHKDDILIEKGLVQHFEEVYTKGKTVHLLIDYDYSKVKHVDVLNATRRILDCTIFPIKDPDGRVTNAVFQQKDVTEQKHAEIKLLESERKYRALADNSRDAIARFDKDFRPLYISPAVVRLSGYEAEEFETKDVFSIVHPEDLPELKEKIRERIENRVENSTSTFRIIQKSGQEVWIEAVSTYCYDGEGRFTGMIVNERDITDRKKVEEELKKALKEKDFLMREINHRIKNNLMTITSLLRLKCQSLETEVDLSDLEHQIDAIRIIHEKLYQDENVTDIRFPEYVQQLLETVFSSFSGGEVVIENRITDCRFSAKIVAPLGLIVNELATNAIKHAFPGFYGETGKEGIGGRSAGAAEGGQEDAGAAAGGGRKADGRTVEKPRFRVEMTRDSERKEYVLRISNNGPPLPEDVEITSPKTLGLLLVSELSVQLGGELEIVRTPHPEFILTFPDPDQ
mgnify:CR=1 FL=1